MNDSPVDCQNAPQLRPQSGDSRRGCHVKNLFCLPNKRGFLQLYPFLPERVIYLRYDIALRAMIYAFGIWGTDITSCLRSKYIIRQRRISYRTSDISFQIVKSQAIVKL
jgi:hypothetical protein